MNQQRQKRQVQSRSRRILIRVNEEEYCSIQQASSLLSMNMSEYIRKSAQHEGLEQHTESVARLNNNIQLTQINKRLSLILQQCALHKPCADTVLICKHLIMIEKALEALHHDRHHV